MFVNIGIEIPFGRQIGEQQEIFPNRAEAGFSYAS
jgi:hypothetical protein